MHNKSIQLEETVERKVHHLALKRIETLNQQVRDLSSNRDRLLNRESQFIDVLKQVVFYAPPNVATNPLDSVDKEADRIAKQV